MKIPQPHGFDASFPFVEPQHLVVQQHLRFQRPRLRQVVQRQHERIDGGIFHGEYGNGVRSQTGLLFQGVFGIDALGHDAACGTAVGKIGNVCLFVSRHGHKESARILHALGGQTLEQSPLLAALPGGVRVRSDIPGAAVQQPVVAARCSGVDILLFDPDAGDAPQGLIPGQPRSGGSAADNQYLSGKSRFRHSSVHGRPVQASVVSSNVFHLRKNRMTGTHIENYNGSFGLFFS